MKKQYIYILLLNVTLFFSARAQTEKLEFDQVKKINELSSENEESMPFPYADGKKIYFVRTVIVGSMKQRVKGQDIWSSEHSGDSWSDPSNLFEAGNDNGNNGVIGVSDDGNTLYLFNSVQTRRKLAKGIAITKRDPDGNWSDLEQVDVPGFKIGDGLYSFYMTPDAKTLLIGMAASDTSSQSDLFVSLKNEQGNWGELRNLGSTINTNGSEITPFISKDGATLYFSSEGHEGFGGMDIFMSKRLDDGWTNWSDPVNMGELINSKEFDAYFMFMNKKEAVFTSNREGLFSDIYSAKLKEEKVATKEETVFAQVFSKTGPLLGTKVKIIDKEGKVIGESTTDKDGKFSFVVLDGEPYEIKVDDDDLQGLDSKVYLTDQKGRKLKRLNLDENGVYTEDLTAFDTELIEGVFEYDDLPQENATLVVVDENGFPIDTITTDENGKFSYERLKGDNNFSFKPINTVDDQLVDNMEIYTTDKEGKRLSDLVINKNQNLDTIIAVKKEETVFAQVFSKTGPLLGTKVQIIDKEGKVIGERTTDKDGKFSFVILDGGPYEIKVDDDDLQGFDSKVYLTDQTGRKLKRLNLDENGVYTEELTAFDTELIEGVFEYDDLPQENATLVVVDENGFPIDTITTDENGKFSYERLKGDNNFSFKPINTVDDQLVDNMQIYTTDKEGKRLSNLIINKDESLATVNSVKKKQSQLASVQSKTKKVVNTPSRNAERNSTKSTVYFNFNEKTLTEDDQLILDKVVSALKENSRASTTMIGFTDNIGSKEVNVKVASARVRSARAYLMEQGIAKNRITIYGYGEVMFKGDNSTKEGRALNRRVEIEVE